MSIQSSGFPIYLLMWQEYPPNDLFPWAVCKMISPSSTRMISRHLSEDEARDEIRKLEQG